MNDRPLYLSYLLRIWQDQNPNNPEPIPSIQIEVEEIQSGQSQHFDTMDELLSYLHNRIALPDPDTQVFVTLAGDGLPTNDQAEVESHYLE